MTDGAGSRHTGTSTRDFPSEGILPHRLSMAWISRKGGEPIAPSVGACLSSFTSMVPVSLSRWVAASLCVSQGKDLSVADTREAFGTIGSTFDVRW